MRLVSGFSEEKRLSVYSSTASYSLAVREQNGAEYVGLLEILSPWGRSAPGPMAAVWRLSFNRVDGEFTPGTNPGAGAGEKFRPSGQLLAGKWARPGAPEFPTRTHAALSGNAGKLPRKFAALVYRQCGGPLYCPGKQNESAHPGDEFHCAGESHDCHRAGETAHGVYPGAAGPSRIADFDFRQPGHPFGNVSGE